MQRFERKSYRALLGACALGGALIFVALNWRLPPTTPKQGMPSGYDMMSPSGSFGGGSGLQSASGPSRSVLQPDEPWRPAQPREREEAQNIIRLHLLSFKSGRYDRALSYQTRESRAGIASPKSLRNLIEDSYPIFIRFDSVRFGPTQCDAGGNRFYTRVRLLISDDTMAEAQYELAREEGRLLVARVSNTHSRYSLPDRRRTPQEPLPAMPRMDGSPEI